jgi:hypothetical protein
LFQVCHKTSKPYIINPKPAQLESLEDHLAAQVWVVDASAVSALPPKGSSNKRAVRGVATDQQHANHQETVEKEKRTPEKS